MIIVLVLSTIPAVLAAAGFDSPALALLAVAGLVWAGALFVCTVPPVIPGRDVSLTETVATGLSTVGAIIALLGMAAILIGAF